MNKLRSEVQVLKFDLDRQNQYSRREPIRISDISETGENTNALVTKLAADIGVSVTETDISVSHRLPGRPGSARSVIVKCVRRVTKTSMMKNKRRLCDLDLKGVFLNDDLTPFRVKLARTLRNDSTIGKVWTIDGRIICMITVNGNEIRKVVESPEDLFHLAWSEEKVKGLHLYI